VSCSGLWRSADVRYCYEEFLRDAERLARLLRGRLPSDLERDVWWLIDAFRDFLYRDDVQYLIDDVWRAFEGVEDRLAEYVSVEGVQELRSVLARLASLALAVVVARKYPEAVGYEWR